MQSRMSLHRYSYWKTTLTSLFVSAALGVTACWLANGDIRVLGHRLLGSAILYWIVIMLLSLVSLFSLMVALGGILCLRDDSRELARCLNVVADANSEPFFLPKPVPDHEDK